MPEIHIYIDAPEKVIKTIIEFLRRAEKETITNLCDLKSLAQYYGIQYWDKKDFEKLKEINIFDKYELVAYPDYVTTNYWLTRDKGYGIWKINYGEKTYYFFLEYHGEYIAEILTVI